MEFTFEPEIRTLGHIESRYRTSEISSEPMLFQADLDFARTHGGPITNRIIDELFLSHSFMAFYYANPNVIIDTRATMTKPGMYPSIPGWHCDAVPRREHHSQPDLTKISDDVQHFMVLLSDENNVTNTEFVTEPVTIDVDEDNVWNSVDRYIENNDVKTSFLKEGDIIRFTQTAIHRASVCKKRGWRFFFRLSLGESQPKNEIRKQVQVYVTSNGW